MRTEPREKGYSILDPENRRNIVADTDEKRPTVKYYNEPWRAIPLYTKKTIEGLGFVIAVVPFIEPYIPAVATAILLVTAIESYFTVLRMIRVAATKGSPLEFYRDQVRTQTQDDFLRYDADSVDYKNACKGFWREFAKFSLQQIPAITFGVAYYLLEYYLHAVRDFFSDRILKTSLLASIGFGFNRIVHHYYVEKYLPTKDSTDLDDEEDDFPMCQYMLQNAIYYIPRIFNAVMVTQAINNIFAKYGPWLIANSRYFPLTAPVMDLFLETLSNLSVEPEKQKQSEITIGLAVEITLKYITMLAFATAGYYATRPFSNLFEAQPGKEKPIQQGAVEFTVPVVFSIAGGKLFDKAVSFFGPRCCKKKSSSAPHIVGHIGSSINDRSGARDIPVTSSDVREGDEGGVRERTPTGDPRYDYERLVVH